VTAALELTALDGLFRIKKLETRQQSSVPLSGLNTFLLAQV
jgi:hypothetical protein